MAEKERFCGGLRVVLERCANGLVHERHLCSLAKVHLRCRRCLHCADRMTRVEDELPIAWATSRFEHGDDNRCGGATEGEIVARRSLEE